MSDQGISTCQSGYRRDFQIAKPQDVRGQVAPPLRRLHSGRGLSKQSCSPTPDSACWDRFCAHHPKQRTPCSWLPTSHREIYYDGESSPLHRSAPQHCSTCRIIRAISNGAKVERPVLALQYFAIREVDDNSREYPRCHPRESGDPAQPRLRLNKVDRRNGNNGNDLHHLSTPSLARGRAPAGFPLSRL